MESEKARDYFFSGKIKKKFPPLFTLKTTLLTSGVPKHLKF